MRTLYNFLNSYIYKDLKLTDTQKECLLALDAEYGVLYKDFWYKWDRTDCKNLKEEFDKFIRARKKGKKYFPKLQLVKDNLTEEWLEKAKQLRRKFEGFSCYLSKFYIQNIDYMYNQVYMTTHKNDPVALSIYNNTMYRKIGEQEYQYAWKLIKENPYQNVTQEQPYRGEDIFQDMKDHIAKRNFGFNVVLNPNMVARQNVEPHNRVLHIKTDGYFNDLDVESLKIHEIDVHVARRYWGYNLGLNLMADGLLYRNTLDEGMAIYQSLHKNKYGVKPNLKFEIAIKVVIGKHILEKDFCEIFDLIIDKVRTEQNKDVIDFIVFKDIARFKRAIQDCSLLGGSSHEETDYLMGYLTVKDLPEKTKKDIIKYNIGPEQLQEIQTIKEFFRLNKFNLISNE